MYILNFMVKVLAPNQKSDFNNKLNNTRNEMQCLASCSARSLESVHPRSRNALAFRAFVRRLLAFTKNTAVLHSINRDD